MLKVVGINFESIVDGDGVRVVIFFSGCKHHCKGCHNPASHNFHAGRSFDDEMQSQIIEYIRKTPFISGVTLSGGDPMYSAAEIVPFVRKLRSALPHISVWAYSGFTYEEICADRDMRSLLRMCDVLVDGPFILERRNITLEYRGSVNQRIIDVPKSIEANEVVPWKNYSA